MNINLCNLRNLWFKVMPILALSMPLYASAEGVDSLKTRRSTTYSLGYGTTEILDTYLSGNHFEGDGMTVLSTNVIEKDGRKWFSVTQQQFNLSSAKDRQARKTTELEACYSLFYGKMRSWDVLFDGLRVKAGGVGNLNLGVIYNTKNSNNPAQARLSLNVMPTVGADYSFKLFKKQATVDYELMLPLAGIAFSPNYGQSYYEIFSEGNTDHNVMPTTFVSAPNFRQQLSFSYPISRRCNLSIGYLGDYQQLAVNNLKQHIYSHRIMLGLKIRR